MLRDVLRRALADDNLEDLMPLLFRVVADRILEGGWSRTDLDLLTAHLNEAVISGDPEQHQEILSFLTVRQIQGLLESGDPTITRHVVLVTLRETLARRHPLFFSDVWPYEHGGRDRAGVLGEEICRVLNSLQVLYWHTQSATAVFQIMATCGGERKGEDVADRTLAMAGRQRAEDVARRLETVSNISGLFLRLRQQTCVIAFRPLAGKVRDGRVREVQEALASLRRKYENGELEAEIVQTLGGTKQLRTAHLDSLSRYIS
jgi:hypothetical protein